MSIELWAARLERPLSEREEQAMLPILPPVRCDRLLHVTQHERRREALCAYTILFQALREKYHWTAFPNVALSPMGKPYFPEFPTVHFNISHTSGAVLAAVSDQPVGVDIEKIRPVSERAMMRLAGAATEKEFFQSWVRREARVKRAGSGVGTMNGSDSPLQPGEFFYFLDLFDGYAAGVATRSTDLPKNIRRYSLDELMN